MKKLFLCIMWIFFSFGIISSCGQKEENVSQETEYPTESLEEKKELDNQDKEVSKEEKKDNLKENISEEEKNDDKSSQLDVIESLESNIPLALLENYKEKMINSIPELKENKEQYCTIIRNKENQLEYYTVSCEEESSSFVWKYILENEEWKKEEVFWLEGLKNEVDQRRITVIAGQDQNEYAWYIGQGEKPHLVKRVENAFVEITIPDLDITEQAKVAVLKNGNVVFADRRKECFIYNVENGSLLKNFRCGWYKSLCVGDNQIFILDPENHSVLHYDAERMESLPIIKGNLGVSAMLFIDGNYLYACGQGGIYQSDINGEQFQKILDSGIFHFSKKDGILLQFFVVGEIFYVSYGEEGGILMKYFPMGEEPLEENTNMLVIYSLESNDLIIDMISAFQEKYPDIEIQYETGEGAEGSTTISDRVRVLNARILAGNGPDLLVMDDLLAESYLEKGLLADLSSALAEEREELLPNILSAYTQGDKLYMLPLRLRIPLIFTSGQETEVFSSLQALTEYSVAQGGGVIKPISYQYCLEMLYCNFTPNIILQDGSVDQEAIREFLSLTKNLCEIEQVTEESIGVSKLTYFQGVNPEWWFGAEEAQILFANIRGLNWMNYMPTVAKKRGGQMLGAKGIFIPNGLLAVNNQSKEKELALKFVTTMFMEEQQAKGGAELFPIHQKVLEAQAEKDLSMITTGITKSDGDTLMVKYFDAKDAAQMVEIVKEVYNPCTVNSVIFEIIQEEAISYFKENQSLEESVQKITSRIQLYLYEG